MLRSYYACMRLADFHEFFRKPAAWVKANCLLLKVAWEVYDLGGAGYQGITRVWQVVLTRPIKILIWPPLIPAGYEGGGLNAGTMVALPLKSQNPVSLVCSWCLLNCSPFAGPQGECLGEVKSVQRLCKRTTTVSLETILVGKIFLLILSHHMWVWHQDIPHLCSSYQSWLRFFIINLYMGLLFS